MTFQNLVGVGDVLTVKGGTGFFNKLIKIGAVLRGRPGLNSHVVVVHHKDEAGNWQGIEGRPGGVGWTTLDKYFHDPYTINNCLQNKTEQQRYDIAVAAEGLLGTPYDWVGIIGDGMDAIGASKLWKIKRPDGPPAHVVCSSFAAWLYQYVGLDRPFLGKAEYWAVTPGDWTAFSMENNFSEDLDGSR